MIRFFYLKRYVICKYGVDIRLQRYFFRGEMEKSGCRYIIYYTLGTVRGLSVICGCVTACLSALTKESI